MKRILFLSILPLFLIGENAPASAAPVTPDCGIVGMVKGGAGYQGGNANISGPNLNMSDNFLGFGETAIGYGCGNWMAQLDGAFYHSGFSNNGIGQIIGQDNQGHIGGAVFWRDSSVGRLGFAASEILNNAHFNGSGFPNGLDVGGSLMRGGAFGDFYASDTITLGAGAFYVTGNPINIFGLTLSESGLEGNIHAKFYAKDNISFSLQGDIQSANVTSLGQITAWNGYAGSAEAEYLVAHAALSLLLGGRIANRSLGQGTTVTINDEQAYIGVKWTFGAPVSSLRARDRADTYDNTSLFDEKLPGLEYDTANAASH